MSPANKSDKSNFPNKRLHVPGGFKSVSLVLFIVIVVMFALWRPWVTKINAADRTISVTGNATISAVPDEYVFSPTYDFTNSNQQTALANFTATSGQIVAQLKNLGVASSDIQTDASNYSGGVYLPVVSYENGNADYTLNITITIDNAALAQKVQNYLLTTNPTGQISPTVNFSTAEQNKLDNQARNIAEQNARANANQSAANLGFKIAAVKSVQDGSLGGVVYPVEMNNGATTGVAPTTSSSNLSLQPGKNTLTYSVSVTYYID